MLLAETLAGYRHCIALATEKYGTANSKKEKTENVERTSGFGLERSVSSGQSRNHVLSDSFLYFQIRSYRRLLHRKSSICEQDHFTLVYYKIVKKDSNY